MDCAILYSNGIEDRFNTVKFALKFSRTQSAARGIDNGESGDILKVSDEKGTRNRLPAIPHCEGTSATTWLYEISINPFTVYSLFKEMLIMHVYQCPTDMDITFVYPKGSSIATDPRPDGIAKNIHILENFMGFARFDHIGQRLRALVSDITKEGYFDTLEST